MNPLFPDEDDMGDAYQYAALLDDEEKTYIDEDDDYWLEEDEDKNNY